jgi:hypothetical protein
MLVKSLGNFGFVQELSMRKFTLIFSPDNQFFGLVYWWLFFWFLFDDRCLFLDGLWFRLKQIIKLKSQKPTSLLITTDLKAGRNLSTSVLPASSSRFNRLSTIEELLSATIPGGSFANGDLGRSNVSGNRMGFSNPGGVSKRS